MRINAEMLAYIKSKVGVRTKSMKSIVAACFVPEPDQILMPDAVRLRMIEKSEFYNNPTVGLHD